MTDDLWIREEDPWPIEESALDLDDDGEQDEQNWAAMSRRGSERLLAAILAYQAKRGHAP